jgi:hypothetical protein
MVKMVQVAFWMVYQPISGFVLELGLIVKPFIEGGVWQGNHAKCYWKLVGSKTQIEKQ